MKARDILSSHNFKRTSCREGILEIIMNSDQALSENEVRERLTGNYDRTTFYRTFNALEKSGIIHKIVVDNRLVKYAIIRQKQHAHFYCAVCNEVKCMNNIPVQKYKLPAGYSDIETEVLIKGTCAKCKMGEEE